MAKRVIEAAYGYGDYIHTFLYPIAANNVTCCHFCLPSAPKVPFIFHKPPKQAALRILQRKLQDPRPQTL